MKKIALIVCALMLSCIEARDINKKPIELKCIRFNYAMPESSNTAAMVYCFDTENALCYTWNANDGLASVDFRTCYDLFVAHIDSSGKAEKEP